MIYGTKHTPSWYIIRLNLFSILTLILISGTLTQWPLYYAPSVKSKSHQAQLCPHLELPPSSLCK